MRCQNILGHRNRGGELRTELKKAKEQLKACKNDLERWTWLFHNQQFGFVVILDVETSIIHPDDTIPAVFFDVSIGWSDGVKDALDYYGIAWKEL
jgi:hypothetical protein